MFQFLQSKGIQAKIIFLSLMIIVCMLSLIQFYVLPVMANRVHQDRQDGVRQTVEVIHEIIEASPSQEQALALIKAVRIDGGTYFWIHNMDNKMVMHPVKPELDGKDLSDMKDPTGDAFFNRMTELVKKSHQGFVHYHWPKPGQDQPVAKVSYVMALEKWGWIIGSGVYTDDIEADLARFRLQIWSAIAALSIAVVVVASFLVRRLNRELQAVSGDVAQKAQTFQSVSSKLKQQSADLAERSSEGAAAIQETSASLHEITAMIGTASERVNSLDRLSQSFSNEVSSGKRNVNEMIDSMRMIERQNKQLSEQVAQSEQEMREIVSLIAQISEKTKVINDIVFQTKILSFNASVEAARAGEAGKGFAVVAEEVGSLARLSGESAGAISAILNESTQRVDAIVRNNEERLRGVMSEISESLSLASTNADRCGSAFTRIVEGTSEMGGMVSDILAAVNEQSAGVSEINKAMHNLSDVTQKNSETSHEVQESAAQLQTGSSQLNGNVLLLQRIIEGEHRDGSGTRNSSAA